jgi:hypothetical protein
MSGAAHDPRRAELLDRCRTERNAFIAVASRKLAALPRARDAARVLRTLRGLAHLALRATR